MDSVALWSFMPNLEGHGNLRRYRRLLRNRSKIMSLPDTTINKAAFSYIANEIRADILPSSKCGLTIENKLVACLRFFAEGCYQLGTGKDFDAAIAQSTFSKVFSSLLNVLERRLCPKWISLNMDDDEKREAKLYFFERSGFPGSIMCVDGTHVKIKQPVEDKSLYYNRKGFFSLNVMIICDHKNRIRFVDPRHQGASHDSHVWRLSEARTIFEQRYRNGERNSWILGDAGYPLEPWLMTPFRNAASGSPEINYNKKHAKARNIVERTIGMLKNRFRCILQERQLNYSPDKAAKIVNVCCALHNICLYFRATNFDEFEHHLDYVEQDTDDTSMEIITDSTEAQQIRNSILFAI